MPGPASASCHRADRAVRAAGLRAGIVVDRVVGADAAVRRMMILPLLLTPLDAGAAIADATAGQVRDPAGADLSDRLFPVRRRLHRLHDLHDRLCARWRRRRAAQSAFWSLIGVSAFVDALGLAPACWRSIAAASPPPSSSASTRSARRCRCFGHSPLLLAISALVFGVAFFAVVARPPLSCASTIRRRHGRPAIAAMTIAFGIGQTLGPIAVGAITDAMGSLSLALNVSAAMLALGAVLCAFQRKVRPSVASGEWRVAKRARNHCYRCQWSPLRYAPLRLNSAPAERIVSLVFPDSRPCSRW